MKNFLFLILISLLPASAFAQLPGKIPNKFGQTYADNAYVRYGNSEDAECGYSTVQTPDALVCEVSGDSNNFILMEKGDQAYDFAHALSTDPTLYIQSHNQSATQWISLKHNGTDGVIDVGTGKVSFPDGITATITGNVTGNVDGIVGGTTPAAGSFTTITASSTIRSTAATNIGWSVVAGANTACNTTCTNACVFGQDTGGANKTILDCADATADLCVCAGAN